MSDRQTGKEYAAKEWTSSSNELGFLDVPNPKLLPAAKSRDIFNAAILPASSPLMPPSPAVQECPVELFGYFAHPPAAYIRDATASSVFTAIRPSSSKHTTVEGSRLEVVEI
jgi:hypothetical protein